MADRVLLLGINEYQNVSHLRGCLNDVDEMQGVLTDVFGFRKEDMIVRKDKEVTRTRLERDLDWLLSELQPGDRAVLHFSGHGSYTEDTTGLSEDGQDELLCLYDMDWNNHDTYMLDKELRRRFDGIPADVLLVIMDNCHSGNGTRRVDLPNRRDTHGTRSLGAKPLAVTASTLARAGTKEYGERALGIGAEATRGVDRDVALQERHVETVLARFIPPPPEVEERVMQRRRQARSLGRGPREIPESAMTETLLAACARDQTSADAFIDGDFHGAFSYYLGRALKKSGRSVNGQDLMTVVTQDLKAGHFNQDAHIEGRDSEGALFRGSANRPFHQGQEMTGEGPATGGSALDTQQQVLDLLNKILSILGGTGRPGGPRGDILRGVVYVHGICPHRSGYSDAWWQAMSPYVPRLQPGSLGGSRKEVLWSDLVNSARALSRDIEGQSELRERLKDILEDRAQRHVLDNTPQASRDEQPVEAIATRELPRIPGLDCIDDFTVYLLDRGLRMQVIDRFRAVVEPMLRDGAEVDVISHSWGTVVAYEAMRLMEGLQTSGMVANFFTVGSALSISEVRRRLLPEASGGKRPRFVRRWINLEARGDIVGGILKGRGFEVDFEFLNLEPVGCRQFLGVVTPSCAHGSYFDQDNRTVNQGIFGRYIES